MSVGKLLYVLIVCFAAVPSASGKRPLAKGSPCGLRSTCAKGLQCVLVSDGGRCELVCGGRQKCPENQRCVQDGASYVCRSIISDVEDPER